MNHHHRSTQRNTPFLCNNCSKWNTDYIVPTCWKCKHPKSPTCYPATVLLLRYQYVFTVDEYKEHAKFPITKREELRTLRVAYDTALAQEAERYRASKTAKGKFKSLFRAGSSSEEEESIHDVYIARKKEIEDRKEEKHFLKGIRVDQPAIYRRVDDRAWVVKLSVVVAFAKIDIPCLERLNTKLSDRVAILLAFLQDLDSLPGGNEVVIELEDRRILTVQACIDGLVKEQIPFVGGDIAEIVSQYRTSTGRIMTTEESLRRYG